MGFFDDDEKPKRKRKKKPRRYTREEIEWFMALAAKTIIGEEKENASEGE